VNVLVSLEGILSSNNTDNKSPNRTGVLLYYWLIPHNRVAIFTSWDKKEAEHWLLTNGIIDYAELIDSSYALLGEDLSQRQITVARSRQPVELLLTADPTLGAWAFDNGIPSLVFAHPESIAIPHRPGMKAWGAIEESIDKRNIQRSLDAQKEQLFFTD